MPLKRYVYWSIWNAIHAKAECLAVIHVQLPTPFYHHPYTLEALLEIALDPQTVQVVAFVFINIFDDTMNPTVKKIRAAGGDEGVLTERQRRKMKEGEWKAMLTLKWYVLRSMKKNKPTLTKRRNVVLGFVRLSKCAYDWV